MSPAGAIELTVDGRKVTVPAGTSVFDAARLNGIAIPTLCHQQNETPVGVCRICVVDVGGRVLTASCVRPAENGMVVNTASDRVRGARRTLLELLMSDHPSPCARQQNTGDCELETLAKQSGITQPRFVHRSTGRGKDDSSPAIAVEFDACILCDRCIRGCSEIRHNFVLGRMGKGAQAGIAFDNNLPMGSSSCVSCGECMVSCPTGALTNKGVTGTALKSATNTQQVTPEELEQLPVFKGVSGTFLSLNRGAVVRRNFKKGEVICREGEYGSTAFYILSGRARVSISSPMAHVKTHGGAKGFFSKLTSALAKRQEDKREEETDQRYIHIDAPIDLKYENPVAELGAGDLFGEMTCMSLYPRSATVRAETDCTMLEMLRNVLDIMQRNKTFRAQMERAYRTRALDSHLRSVPVFSTLTNDFIDQLRNRVELVGYARICDLQTGRSGGQLLSDSYRICESVRGAARGKPGTRVSGQGRVLRRNRFSERDGSNCNLLSPRPRRGGEILGRRLQGDARPLPRSTARTAECGQGAGREQSHPGRAHGQRAH